MKKMTFCLLALCAVEAQAAEGDMTISVESTRLSDVSGEEVKSADLAEALSLKVPSVSLVRRSGIANDVILRGQKKDNINIVIDNAKVYGACPNRMDPPTSHILTNNIDGIEIIEGPYDVENFGTLSGAVKVSTKKPSEEFQGEVSLNIGSWGYQKAATTVSGGTEKVRMLASISTETSDQYKDGDGNDFVDQIALLGVPGVQYQTQYQDLPAYEKRTFMGKAYIDVAENQQLKLSYTANRSDDILYPSSKMDALYDDSDIINVDYTFSNLGEWSKQLEIQFFDSSVDHPMSNKYRNSAMMMEMTSALTTHTQGLKLINSLDLSESSELRIGIDTSNRNWDGEYEGGMVTGEASIDDVDTRNLALFAELEKSYGRSSVKAGVRFDNTHIEPGGSVGQPDNDYSSVSANLFANHSISDSLRLFGGIGRAYRVPDARELYFRNSSLVEIGTPDLKQTSNTEFDLGLERRFENASIKAKVFYSVLEDYIYFNSTKAGPNKFENVDAVLYGLDISGDYFFADNVYLDYGYAQLAGEKKSPLSGQNDTNLAEVPPYKLTLAMNIDYAPGSSARFEAVGVGAWEDYDAENGEQLIGGYRVFNLKVTQAVTRSIELTAGVNNMMDTTYQTTNTYKDLTLLADGSGDVMLINEPGRYYYLNASYRF